jgi:hypothetical protein
MKSKEVAILYEFLDQMSAVDLRYLCSCFELSKGGSKYDMIARIVDAGYEFNEIVQIAGFIILMSDIEDAFNKDFYSEILENSGVAYSGSKHTLALRVIENDLISPKELLDQIPMSTLRSLYHSRYGKVSTKSKSETIYEILVSYKIPDRKVQNGNDKEPDIARKHPSEDIENFAFVLMPFRNDLTEIYRNIIKPTVESYNYQCKRADDFFTANKIMDDIEKAIRNCSFVIADLTGKNPNVFYEVGMSHILDKKVILLAQSIEDIPFDLRQWRHIRYYSSEKGQNKLSKELKKTIKGVLKEL